MNPSPAHALLKTLRLSASWTLWRSATARPWSRSSPTRFLAAHEDEIAVENSASSSCGSVGWYQQQKTSKL